VLFAFLTFISSTFIAPCLSLAQQTPASAEPTPAREQEDAQPVVFTVTVTNKRGGYVNGLDKSSFVILDGKTAQDITYFKGQEEPVSVGILIDASGSMAADSVKRDLLKTLYTEALPNFIRQSNEANTYFLIGLNDRPQLLLDWRRGLDAVNDILVKFGEVKLKGETALYDACYLAVEKLTRSAHRKRAIIVISDGQDNASHYTFTELRRLLKESDVLFYAVGLNSALELVTQIGMQGRGILDEFALISGGMAVYPEKPAHVRNAFDFIATELRHQYAIGFKPTSSPNQRDWHRIKIKLALPANAPPELRHLLIRSREGYYPKATPR
jgi:Ca-activated chloride channel family protein